MAETERGTVVVGVVRKQAFTKDDKILETLTGQGIKHSDGV